MGKGCVFSVSTLVLPFFFSQHVHPRFNHVNSIQVFAVCLHMNEDRQLDLLKYEINVEHSFVLKQSHDKINISTYLVLQALCLQAVH